MRPGNVALGVVAVVAGAASVGLHASMLAALLGTMLAAVLGMAGANLLNDATDAALDRAAHPNRAIAQGRVSPAQAAAMGVALLASGVTLAWLVGPAVGWWATTMALLVLLYEAWGKRRGLAGNLLISASVAGLFPMGAAAALGLQPWTMAALAGAWAADAGAARAMGAMSWWANTAREVYKDVEDAQADRVAGRRSLVERVGPREARIVAAGFLFVSALLALFLFYRGPPFDDVYLVLVLPAVLIFGLAALAREASQSQRAVKLGMGFALAAFLSVGII